MKNDSINDKLNSSSIEAKKAINENYYHLIGEAHMKQVALEMDNLTAKEHKMNESDMDMETQIDVLDQWFDDFHDTHVKIEKKQKRHSNRMKRMKRVAIILVLFISGMALTMTFVEAFRVKVLNLVEETHERYTDFSVDEIDNSMAIENLDVANAPKWIPEGFYIEDTSIIGEKIHIFYSDELKEKHISYAQTSHNAEIQLDTENATRKEIKLHGMDALLYEKENRSVLFWYDAEKIYYIIGNLSGEEIVKMGESIYE